MRAGGHFTVGLVADAPDDLVPVQLQPSAPGAGWAFHCPGHYCVSLGWAWVRHYALLSGGGGWWGTCWWAGQYLCRVRCGHAGTAQRVRGVRGAVMRFMRVFQVGLLG